MKVYLTNPNATGAISMAERPEPRPNSNQAVVRVTHFSLNRGELYFAQTGEPDRQIGWDIAGIVESSAVDGTGPAAGRRVVGFSRASLGWAEKVAVDTRDLAVIPDGVTSVQAASLPVAGLTALYALERGKRLLGSRVLVTGATGGVGSFAVSLGALMGAQVVAQVRRKDQEQPVLALGAQEIVVDEVGDLTAEAGPFRLIVDGLGNELTAKAIHSLAPDGIAVLYGVTAGSLLQISPGFMLGTGTGRVEGFNLYRESEKESIARGLDRLLRLVQSGQLNVQVDTAAPWDQAPDLAQQLTDRRFSGKAVLSVGANQ
jgi:NADPH:quinone reductase-like Zn-dependent oxidoreductase